MLICQLYPNQNVKTLMIFFQTNFLLEDVYVLLTVLVAAYLVYLVWQYMGKESKEKQAPKPIIKKKEQSQAKPKPVINAPTNEKQPRPKGSFLNTFKERMGSLSGKIKLPPFLHNRQKAQPTDQEIATQTTATNNKQAKGKDTDWNGIPQYEWLPEPTGIADHDDDDRRSTSEIPLPMFQPYTFSDDYDDQSYVPDVDTETVIQQQVLRPFAEEKTKHPDRLFLGFSEEELKRDVLEYGLADFNRPYYDYLQQRQQVPPYKRVLAYANYNIYKAYFASFHTFAMLCRKDDLRLLFRTYWDDSHGLVILEVGGSMMATALSMGSYGQKHFKRNLRLQYWGIDTAQSMLELSDKLSNCAVFDEESEFHYTTNWHGIPFASLRNLIIISFPLTFERLSRSEGGDYGEMVNQIMRAHPDKTVLVLAIHQDKSEKLPAAYSYFKHCLEDYQLIAKGQDRFSYKTDLADPDNFYEDKVRYELLMNPAGVRMMGYRFVSAHTEQKEKVSDLRDILGGRKEH